MAEPGRVYQGRGEKFTSVEQILKALYIKHLIKLVL